MTIPTPAAAARLTAIVRQAERRNAHLYDAAPRRVQHHKRYKLDTDQLRFGFGRGIAHGARRAGNGS
jgi:hypothetical protein